MFLVDYMKYLRIVLLIIWMALIFSFSNDNGEVSSSRSDVIVKQLFTCYYNITNKEIDSEKLEIYTKNTTLVVRKTAHIIEYLVLAFLLCSVIKDYKNLDKKFMLIALILCFLYACSDETHQLLISGRSAKIYDVFIDTFGSFIGIMIYKFICYRRIINKKTN